MNILDSQTETKYSFFSQYNGEERNFYYIQTMETSLKSLEIDLQNMEVRLTEMEEKIDAINTKLTQVVDAILGNPLTKTGGFIKDIELLKEKIHLLEKAQQEHQEFKKKISWTVGIIIGAGIVIQYIINIYAAVKK